MTARRWKILIGPKQTRPTIAEVAEALAAVGDVVADSDDFEAALIKFDNSRLLMMEAGFWLGRGKLVVALQGDASWNRTASFRKLAGRVFRDMDEFAAWLNGTPRHIRAAQARAERDSAE